MATIPRDPDVLDDLHFAEGKEVTADQKVPFGFRGKNYTIDLTDENATRLADALAPFIGVAEQVETTKAAGRGATRSTSGRSTTRPERDLTQKIREWAASQGIELNDKGRIKNEVREAYFDAHPQDRPAG